MAFVAVEKLTRVIPNKYEAVLVAAKDARIQNSIARLRELDPNIPQPKVTTLSLYRLIDGEIHYYYAGDDMPAPSADAASGDTELLDLDEESKTDA